MITDLPITCTWEPTFNQNNTGSILTVYTGGNHGAEFSKLSNEDRVATAISQVDKVFPGSAKHVLAAKTIAWINESFSQGGYLSFATGQVVPHWNTLRESVGRLYFAGEHTAVNQGFMDGAVESGQRAAKEILQRESRQ